MDSLILDNPVFNVKGQGKKMLKKTIELGLACVGHSSLAGYRVDNKKGIILYWTKVEKDDFQPFESDKDLKEITKTVLSQIENLEIVLDEENDEFSDLELDDGDVGSDFGWRVYTEQWGRIEGDWQACLAVVPSFLWIGK